MTVSKEVALDFLNIFGFNYLKMSYMDVKKATY